MLTVISYSEGTVIQKLEFADPETLRFIDQFTRISEAFFAHLELFGGLHCKPLFQ